MKAKRIYIDSQAAKLTPRRAHWGEEGLKKVVIPAGTILFHVSVMGQIETFAEAVTCFSTNRPALPGEIYVAIIKEDIEAEQHNTEYRIDLTEDSPIEIYYIGTTETLWDTYLVPKGHDCRPSFRVVRYSLVDEYKDLEEEWNKGRTSLTPEQIANGWRIISK